MLRILLADDHRMFRLGLRTLLEREPGNEVVGEAADGREAVTLARKLEPDIVIMDLQMPILGGVEATRKIRARSPQCRVICLSASSDAAAVRRAIAVGADAYVLKDSAFDQLIEAINVVMKGERFLSPPIVGVVLDDYRRLFSGQENEGASALTPRETEILQLLAEGRSSKQIASILDLSVKTIDTHRQNLMRKLHLNGIADLTKFAIREGLASLDF